MLFIELCLLRFCFIHQCSHNRHWHDRKRQTICFCSNLLYSSVNRELRTCDDDLINFYHHMQTHTNIQCDWLDALEFASTLNMQHFFGARKINPSHKICINSHQFVLSCLFNIFSHHMAKKFHWACRQISAISINRTHMHRNMRVR